MDIWVKIFEVGKGQVLVEKATAWDDERGKDMPAVVLRRRTDMGELNYTMFYESAEERDAGFDAIIDETIEAACGFMKILEELED